MDYPEPVQSIITDIGMDGKDINDLFDSPCERLVFRTFVYPGHCVRVAVVAIYPDEERTMGERTVITFTPNEVTAPPVESESVACGLCGRTDTPLIRQSDDVLACVGGCAE